MKSLLIIIHGRKVNLPKSFKAFWRRFYSYFGVDIGDDKWSFDLRRYIEKFNGFDVLAFNWTGGISRLFSINPSAKKLAKLIDNSPHQKIVLFGKSLGGTVAEIAIKKSKYRNKISKIIYVATPHKSNKVLLPRSVKIVNIYSNEDKVLDLANILLHFCLGSKHLKNGRNIIIKNLCHSDFNKNIEIYHDNKKIALYDFYKKIIYEQ